MDARAVMADVAGVGPFFAVGTDSVRESRPGFRPVGELWSDPAPLHERITYVGGALGVDDRVAASVAFQGLAAGLVAAPFAAAVAHGAVPRFGPATVLWRPVPSGPWPLWWPEPEVTTVAGPEQAAWMIGEQVLHGLVAPLVAAVRARVPVAERVLWGNTASAVAAAKRLLVVARPALAEPAADVARLLLTRGALAGSGRLLPAAAPDAGWSFRRRSCCLYYRAPHGGLCDDCVLHDRPPPSSTASEVPVPHRGVEEGGLRGPAPTAGRAGPPPARPPGSTDGCARRGSRWEDAGGEPSRAGAPAPTLLETPIAPAGDEGSPIRGTCWKTAVVRPEAGSAASPKLADSPAPESRRRDGPRGGPPHTGLAVRTSSRSDPS